MNWERAMKNYLGNYILDDKGEPRRVDSLEEWAQWFETADRSVAKSPVGTSFFVSTVFLGVNHRFTDGAPELWETMIFGPDMRELEGDHSCRRYTSRAAALAGHEEMVAWARAEAERKS